MQVNSKQKWNLLLAASLLLLQPIASNAAELQIEHKLNASLAKVAENNPEADIALTVDDINDLGFALQRIRQQAINIYVEATRKRGAAQISAQLPNLSSVPAEMPKDQASLMPFRRPWLVYFITTLEPLVHLLKEDVKDVESGSRKVDITPEQRKVLDPFIKDWSAGVAKLDGYLTHSADLVEYADKNNIELAKLASDLDKEVSRLEQIREKAFAVVDAMRKKDKSSGKTLPL